jgi:hypothetical protein
LVGKDNITPDQWNKATKNSCATLIAHG